MFATLVLFSSLALTQPVLPTPVAPISVLADDKLPETLFLKEKPKDAKDLKEVKKSAKAGDKVTLIGRIGGRKQPFTSKRAVFFVVDPSLKACNELPADRCPTPWDYCCESRESLTAAMATVQIVGSDGKPLKVDAEGAGGMKPLSRLTIVGTVKEVAKDGAFVINATGIHVE